MSPFWSSSSYSPMASASNDSACKSNIESTVRFSTGCVDREGLLNFLVNSIWTSQMSRHARASRPARFVSCSRWRSTAIRRAMQSCWNLAWCRRAWNHRALSNCCLCSNRRSRHCSTLRWFSADRDDRRSVIIRAPCWWNWCRLVERGALLASSRRVWKLHHIDNGFEENLCNSNMQRNKKSFSSDGRYSTLPRGIIDCLADKEDCAIDRERRKSGLTTKSIWNF